MTNEYVAKYLKLKGLGSTPDFEGDFVWFPESEITLGNSLNLMVTFDLVEECGIEWVIVGFHGDSGSGNVYLSVNQTLRIHSKLLSVAQLDAILAFARGLADVRVPTFPSIPGWIMP